MLVAEFTGAAVIVTVELAMALHPPAVVPFTKYVVVEVGLAYTVAKFVPE